MLKAEEQTRPSRLDTFDRRLHNLLGIACALLLAALAGICFAEVVLRNLTSRSLGWYDELAGFVLVWLTFLGAALAEQRNGHIGVELVERLGAGGEHVFRVTTQFLLLAMQALLLYHGAILAVRSRDTMAITMPISMGTLYAIIPIWAALMMMIHATQIARSLQGETR